MSFASPSSSGQPQLHRRQALKTLGALGIGTTVFQRALAQQVSQSGKITAEMVEQAEWIAGLQLSEEEREATSRSLQNLLQDISQMRQVTLEYIRANRIRRLLMEEMAKLFTKVDLYVGGQDLVIANLTGHPTVVMPHGLGERRGVMTPQSISFTGNLFAESELLTLARPTSWQPGTTWTTPSWTRQQRPVKHRQKCKCPAILDLLSPQVPL